MGVEVLLRCVHGEVAAGVARPDDQHPAPINVVDVAVGPRVHLLAREDAGHLGDLLVAQMAVSDKDAVVLALHSIGRPHRPAGRAHRPVRGQGLDMLNGGVEGDVAA